jgi:FkbM family methyltransferase
MIGDLEYFIRTPDAWRAYLAWPVFSLTSHRQISSLRRQGIIPRSVIDVGANIGQFAIACAKIFPDATVHSFEPVPECVARLRHNTEKLPKVRVHAVALGERAGRIVLNVNSFRQSSSILRLAEIHRAAFPDAREVAAIEVPLSTLDREMKGVPLDAPALLKLDVQGYEPQVLKGASETLRKMDYVLLESSFRPMYEGENTFLPMVQVMERQGFAFLRPAGWLSDPRSREILQCDALFVNQNIGKA